MAGKKATFTCKICGGEHAGLICTKYSSVRVIEPRKPTDRVSRPLALPAPPPLYPQPQPGETVTVTKIPKTVTPAVTVSSKGGRGKKSHDTPAQKQAAYRARKKAAKA